MISMYSINLLSTYVNKKLLSYLNNDDAEKVSQYFSKHSTEINVQSHFGNTLLMKAAKQGQQKICKKLIDCRANLNLQNNHGETALMRAAANGNKEVVSCLVLAGAKLDLQNKDGETALILACKLQQYEVAKMLIAFDAEVIIRSGLKVFTYSGPINDGCPGSALLYAGLHGNEEVFKQILEKAQWFYILDGHYGEYKVDKRHHIVTSCDEDSDDYYNRNCLSVLLEGVIKSSSHLLLDYILGYNMSKLEKKGFYYALEHCNPAANMISIMLKYIALNKDELTTALVKLTKGVKNEKNAIDCVSVLIKAGAAPSSVIMKAKKRRLYKLEKFHLDQIKTTIPIAYPVTEPSAPLDESEPPVLIFNKYELTRGA